MRVLQLPGFVSEIKWCKWLKVRSGEEDRDAWNTLCFVFRIDKLYVHNVDYTKNLWTSYSVYSRRTDSFVLEESLSGVEPRSPPTLINQRHLWNRNIKKKQKNPQSLHENPTCSEKILEDMKTLSDTNFIPTPHSWPRHQAQSSGPGQWDYLDEHHSKPT